MEHDTYNKQYYQCTQCGHVHCVDINKAIDLCDDMYYAIYCPHCKEVIKHLWVGENTSDFYIYADIILDERYY